MEVNYLRGGQGLLALSLEHLPRAGFSEGSWLPEKRTPKCSGTGDSSHGQNCPLAGEAGRADPRRTGLSPQAVVQAPGVASAAGVRDARG